MALPLLGIAARVAFGAGRGVASLARGATLLVRAGSMLKAGPDADQEIGKVSGRIKRQTLKSVKAATPEQSGRAKRGWRADKGVKNWKISNRVSYIGALNEGSSNQAPRDFVGKAIRGTRK